MKIKFGKEERNQVKQILVVLKPFVVGEGVAMRIFSVQPEYAFKVFF